MITKNDINLYAVKQTWANGRTDYILGYYTRKSADEFFRGYAKGAPEGATDYTNGIGMRFELMTLEEYCRATGTPEGGSVAHGNPRHERC